MLIGDLNQLIGIFSIMDKPYISKTSALQILHIEILFHYHLPFINTNSPVKRKCLVLHARFIQMLLT
jgi:hypothetical protein